ncbi:uncharacterized protein LOC122571748 [Bombus pyrosoma]|uniref:uncharacterized protein LOC122571748 n=1 Tax=Bombus pyrosoma TaxID=396416 RepID=UPI001CB962D9|nr:uncharacterized protein LOC122571748 [Bombus pyrosoma]
MKIPYYTIYDTKHPSGKAHGETAVIIRNDIKHHLHSQVSKEYIQATTVTVQTSSNHFQLSAVYVPPRHKITTQMWKEYFQHLGDKFITAGDYNSKHTLWGTRITSPRGRTLENYIRNNNLNILSTGRPTYWSTEMSKIPDLLDFAVTKGLNVNKLKIAPSLELSSDHTPIIITYRNKPIIYNNPDILCNKTTKWQSFNEIIESKINCNIPLKTPEHIEQAVTTFTETIQESAWATTIPEATKRQTKIIPCHILGHNVARCTVVSPGKKLCRKCGDRDHTINQCTKKPSCAICAKEQEQPETHHQIFLAYPAVKDRRRGNKLETLIQATKRSHPAIMIAGDINLKSTAWGGHVNYSRGTSFLNMFTKNRTIPIRVKEDHTFCKNGRKSFLDIISTNKGLAKNYADNTGDKEAHGDRLQTTLETTCASKLKKVYSPMEQNKSEQGSWCGQYTRDGGQGVGGEESGEIVESVECCERHGQDSAEVKDSENVLRKVCEHTFKNLIEENLGLDPFHEDQYGFRRRTSTVNALRRVVDLTDWSKSWDKILEEAESRGMPRKLLTLLENYLENRKIERSILEPLLWNLVYDGLLNELKAIPKMNVVAFADYLAVILDVATQEEANYKLGTALSVIVRWCAENCRRFGAHLEKMCGKADALIRALRSLLLNINNPAGYAKKLYYEVWESVVPYAAPACAKAVERKKDRNTLKRAQRAALI